MGYFVGVIEDGFKALTDGCVLIKLMSKPLFDALAYISSSQINSQEFSVECSQFSQREKAKKWGTSEGEDPSIWHPSNQFSMLHKYIYMLFHFNKE